MTLIHAADRTYALPDAPSQCGRCGAMSGIFINRRGETFCCRCDCDRDLGLKMPTRRAA